MKYLIIITLFLSPIPIVAQEQEPTKFQRDFIKYVQDDCNNIRNHFGEYKKKIEQGTNPSFYYLHLALLAEYLNNYDEYMFFNAVAVHSYKIVPTCYGDVFLCTRIQQLNRGCMDQYIYYQRYIDSFHVDRDTLDIAIKKIEIQDSICRSIIDSLKKEFDDLRYARDSIASVIKEDSIRQQQYNDNFENIVKKIKGDDTDVTYTFSDNSEVEIICGKMAIDNKVYDYTSVGAFPVGEGCTNDIRAFAGFRFQASFPDTLGRKIYDSKYKPSVELHIFGLADGIGYGKTWGSFDGNTAKFTKPEYDSYANVDKADVSDIMALERVDEATKKNIKQQFYNKGPLSNERLGYLRAFCTYEVIKDSISNRFGDSVNVFTYLYSIQYSKKYQDVKYRSVKILLNTTDLQVHNQGKIGELNEKMRKNRNDRKKLEKERRKKLKKLKKLEDTKSRIDIYDKESDLNKELNDIRDAIRKTQNNND